MDSLIILSILCILLAVIVSCIIFISRLTKSIKPRPTTIVVSEDAVAMLTNMLPAKQDLPRAEYLALPIPQSFPKRHAVGYVYLIKNGHGHTKIGKTTNLERRIKGLQTTSSEKLEIAHVIKSERYGQLEKELHRAFKHKHLTNEWFDLDESDIQTIKTTFG